MANEKNYQHATGSLNHLAMYTYPDIAFAVSKPTQFNSARAATHIKAAMHVLCYLNGPHDLCLVYKRQPITVNTLGYFDADWGSD
jgi:hypothetical protein